LAHFLSARCFIQNSHVCSRGHGQEYQKRR
jgi:hypothetical protein